MCAAKEGEPRSRGRLEGRSQELTRIDGHGEDRIRGVDLLGDAHIVGLYDALLLEELEGAYEEGEHLVGVMSISIDRVCRGCVVSGFLVRVCSRSSECMWVRLMLMGLMYERLLKMIEMERIGKPI